MLNRVFALILLIVLLPLLLVIILAILFFSGAPVFFKHNRCGFYYNNFDLYKFRTMYINNGPDITEFNDDRITKIGKLLRRFKLDELPQLLNIIKGDMEFIGPRPEIFKVVKNHPQYFTYLETVKPGLSDICSIIFKNEAEIFRHIHISNYIEEILPIKSHLILLVSINLSIRKKILLIILSILSVINHKLSLHIISKFLLPYDATDFRIKLNYLLSEEIF